VLPAAGVVKSSDARAPRSASAPCPPFASFASGAAGKNASPVSSAAVASAYAMAKVACSYCTGAPSIRTLVSRHSPGLRAWQSEYNNSGPHSSLEQQPPADRGIAGYFIPGRNRLRDERFALTYFVGRTISST
jgi:hypothetical protein